MREINSFYSKLKTELKENKLNGKIATLYAVEQEGRNHEVALSLLGLLPDLGYAEKISTVNRHLNQFEVSLLRENVSKTLLNCIENIKPKSFSNWHEAKDFDEMLHQIDGSMLTDQTREQFLNLRQRIRIEWQSQVQEVAEVQRIEILNNLTQEREVQSKFRQQITSLSLQQRDALRTQTLQLEQYQQNTTQANRLIDDDIKQVQKELATMGIKMDAQTLVLLQSDAVLRKEVGTAINYLRVQEVRHQQQAQQQKQFNEYQSLINGFAFLGAAGNVTGNSTLQKIAVIGSEATKVEFAFQQMTQLSGIALINPYAAVGMAVLNIASLFLKHGPDQNQVIMEQLQRISKQIYDLHKDMHEQFTSVHQHLKHIEEMIFRNFQQIVHLVAIPIMSKLDEIHSELQTLAMSVEFGFRTVILTELQNIVARVKNIENGIIHPQALTKDTVMELLTILAQWITEKAANDQFTGMLLARRENAAVVWNCTAKQSVQALTKVRDIRNILPLLVYLAPVNNQNLNNNLSLPQTEIWYQAIHNYIALRKIYRHEIGSLYDIEHKQLQEILTLGAQYSDIINDFTGQTTIPLHYISTVLLKLEALQTLHQQALQKYLSVFKPLADENSGQFNASQSLAVIESNAIQYQTFQSAHITESRYSPLVMLHPAAKIITDLGSYLSQNNVTAQQCLNVLRDQARQHNIDLMPKTLLLAEKLGLINISLTMQAISPILQPAQLQQALANAGRSGVSNTPAPQSQFLLNMVIHCNRNQRTYQITSEFTVDILRMARGNISQYNANNPGQCLMNFPATPTVCLLTNINRNGHNQLVNEMSTLLQQALSEMQLNYSQMIAELCREQNSLLYQILRDCRLAELTTGCHQYQLNSNYYSVISAAMRGLEFAIQDPNKLDVAVINDFFQRLLPQLIADLKNAKIEAKDAMQNIIPAVRDVVFSLKDLIDLSKTLPQRSLTEEAVSSSTTVSLGRSRLALLPNPDIIAPPSEPPVVPAQNAYNDNNDAWLRS